VVPTLRNRANAAGKPVDNAFIESFNGKCRDECLNEQLFLSLEQARAEVQAWRLDYNRVRPHSALGNLTPEAYANRSGQPSRTHEIEVGAGGEIGGQVNANKRQREKRDAEITEVATPFVCDRVLLS
jgi:putative transposase